MAFLTGGVALLVYIAMAIVVPVEPEGMPAVAAAGTGIPGAAPTSPSAPGGAVSDSPSDGPASDASAPIGSASMALGKGLGWSTFVTSQVSELCSRLLMTSAHSR